jgi:hypothetical protein
VAISHHVLIVDWRIVDLEIRVYPGEKYVPLLKGAGG